MPRAPSQDPTQEVGDGQVYLLRGSGAFPNPAPSAAARRKLLPRLSAGRAAGRVIRGSETKSRLTPVEDGRGRPCKLRAPGGGVAEGGKGRGVATCSRPLASRPRPGYRASQAGRRGLVVAERGAGRKVLEGAGGIWKLPPDGYIESGTGRQSGGDSDSWAAGRRRGPWEKTITRRWA